MDMSEMMINDAVDEFVDNDGKVGEKYRRCNRLRSMPAS